VSRSSSTGPVGFFLPILPLASTWRFELKANRIRPSPLVRHTAAGLDGTSEGQISRFPLRFVAAAIRPIYFVPVRPTRGRLNTGPYRTLRFKACTTSRPDHVPHSGGVASRGSARGADSDQCSNGEEVAVEAVTAKKGHAGAARDWHVEEAASETSYSLSFQRRYSIVSGHLNTATCGRNEYRHRNGWCIAFFLPQVPQQQGAGTCGKKNVWLWSGWI
jgi:hypothetical protein